MVISYQLFKIGIVGPILQMNGLKLRVTIWGNQVCLTSLPTEGEREGENRTALGVE